MCLLGRWPSDHVVLCHRHRDELRVSGLDNPSSDAWGEPVGRGVHDDECDKVVECEVGVGEEFPVGRKVTFAGYRGCVEMRVPLSDPDALVELERFVCEALGVLEVAQKERGLPHGTRARLPGMANDHRIGLFRPEEDASGLGAAMILMAGGVRMIFDGTLPVTAARMWDSPVVVD